MQRRDYLKLLGSTAGLAVGLDTAAAADTQLEPGTWYDATITDTIDGDTFDVELDSDGTTYNIRVLGIDTPEASGYTRYEEVEGWEGIEDETYLENWGNNASDFAKNELPVGSNCQIAVDSESEELDIYDRLLAKIRYDRTGDGSMNTVYNKYCLEQGYARVYSASMSNTDEYWAAEDTARANGVGIWQQSDPENTTEVRDNAVAETFHPNTSSIKTSGGAISSSRVPIWAESDATQTLNSGAVDYSSGNVPLVGVDEANNVAMWGGQPIQEEHDADSEQLEHFVFLTNLIDHLSADARSGMVLVDGGHHQFNASYSCSAEDTVHYQRYLEGQGIELASINTLGDSTGPSLSDARAIIITSPEDSFTSSELTELQNFVSNGGAVVLMGSYKSTSTQRANLDDVASGIGSDLRLNEDEVTDSTNNVANSDLIKTTNHNTTDFSLWSAYSGSGGDGGYVVSIDTVQRNADSLNDEFVDVTNDGSSDLDMTGWTMENEEGQTYVFPDSFTLSAGSTVRVHTGSGTDSSSDLYWGASMFRWDNDADTCTIYDSNGDVAQDASWSVRDVIISDIDGDNEYVDFTNVSDDSVDMTNWRVEDEAGNDYVFDSFSLASGDTVRLHSGDGTDSSTDLYWGTSYVWNNDGDTAYLYNDLGDLVQERTYPLPHSVSVTDMSLDGSTLNDEWVDVKNDGSSILDMSGFTLEDAAGYDYVFPDSFTLDAGATVRVHTGDGTDTATDLYWGRGAGVWNNDGDTAYVYDDNDVLLEQQASGDLGGGGGGGGGSDSTIAVGQINADGSPASNEWVEFENTGSSDQDMTDWYVQDEAGATYTFGNFTLNAGDAVKLHSGDGTDTSTDLYWGTGYVWNNSGDTVYLYEPDGTLHTKKSY